MHDRSDLKPGLRVRLTPLGVERCPRLASHAGIIVGISTRGQAVRVLIDGRTYPVTLHESYIEPE